MHMHGDVEGLHHLGDIEDMSVNCGWRYVRKKVLMVHGL